MQRHNVVIPTDDGGVEIYPLKEWLRRHPEEIPAGFDPRSSTSHQLRSALKRSGWSMQETPTEIRLIRPGAPITSDFVEEILGSGSSVENDDGDTDPFFSLEYQLRDFLASNIGTIKIEDSRLRLYEDATGRGGVEFPSGVGPIDILAVDQRGAFFVFELKRAHSPDKAIGQVARYMGWLKQTIAKDKPVKGVIVAKSISENLRYAASIVPQVHLFEYQVAFSLRSAHEISVP